MLAQIDVAMGGHVAEKLIIGTEKITSGCSNDLMNATQLATQAVRKYGMFGDRISYSSTCQKQTSEDYNGEVDAAVKKILDVS